MVVLNSQLEVIGFTIGNVYMMMSLLVGEVFGTVSFGAVFGQDGAYWVARTSGNDLLRLTTDGTSAAEWYAG